MHWALQLWILNYNEQHLKSVKVTGNVGGLYMYANTNLLKSIIQKQNLFKKITKANVLGTIRWLV